MYPFQPGIDFRFGGGNYSQYPQNFSNFGGGNYSQYPQNFPIFDGGNSFQNIGQLLPLLISLLSQGNREYPSPGGGFIG
ncbi:MAG: hypothetical protein V2B14_00700 [bacterium]